MLALTRRIGEEIVIGDPAKPLGVIRVVEIHGDKVRLSFKFPDDVQINRSELAEQKLRQARGEAPRAPASGRPSGAPGAPASPGASNASDRHDADARRREAR